MFNMKSIFETLLEDYVKKHGPIEAVMERDDVKSLTAKYPDARRVLETLIDICGPLTVEVISGGAAAPPSGDDLNFIERLKRAYNFNLVRYKKACQFFRSAEASREAKAAHMETYLEICRKIDYLYRTISEIDGENVEAIAAGYVLTDEKRQAA